MKKKDLFNLVKQGLQEVLQEQQRTKNLNTQGPQAKLSGVGGNSLDPVLSDPIFKDPADGESDIDWNTELGVNTSSTPSNSVNFLDFWIVDSSGNNPCQWIAIGDGFINDGSDSGQLNIVDGANTSNAIPGPCPFGSAISNIQLNGQNEVVPAGTSFTQQLCLDFLSGNISGTDQPMNADLTSPNNATGWYITTDCPACTYSTTTNFNVTNADSIVDFTSGTVNEGIDNTLNEQYTVTNSFTIPAGASGITISEDGSCDFEACDANGYDNYLCTVLPAVCSAGVPDVGTLLASITDTGLCTLNGCIDEFTTFNPPATYGLPNLGYICNSNPTVCTGNTINLTYTANNSGGTLNVVLNSAPGTCNPIPPVLGCSVQGYTSYDPNTNVDNGTCEYDGCLTTDTNGIPNTNYICIAVAALCTSNVPNTTYTPTVAYTFDQSTSYNATLTPGTCEQDDIFGCTDPSFAEYSPAHTWDGGTYATELANNAVECQNAIVNGCTDPIANNYYCTNQTGAACTGAAPGTLPVATVTIPNISAGPTTIITLVNDNGSCDYDLDDDGILDVSEQFGCADPSADNYGEQPDGTPCGGSGCTDPGFAGNFTTQNYIDGGCTYTVYGCTDSASPAYLDPATLIAPMQVSNTTIINQISAQNSGDPCQLTPGCTHPDGTLYVGNAAAPFTIDDGSCLFEGCANEYASNPTFIYSNTLPQYDNIVANVDNKSCIFNICNTQGSSNYVCMTTPQLCTDGGISCGFTPCPNGILDPNDDSITNGTINLIACNADGCPDPLAANYDSTVDTDDGSCQYKYCDNMNALNGADNRPPIDLSLINASNPDSVDNSGAPWIFNQDTQDLTICEFEGCTDLSATPSTDPSIEGAGEETFPNSGFYTYNAFNSGCVDPNATYNLDYIPGLNPTGLISPGDDSCCAFPGCIDNGNLDGTGPGSFPGLSGQQFWITNGYDTNINMSGLGNNPHGTIPTYPGFSATNYDPTATNPNGSCKYRIGCTDPLAPNYDGTAEFDSAPTTCLPYCKRIKAIQCNPEPDPNGYAPLPSGMLGGFWEYEKEINVDCTHINNQTPVVGDTFYSANHQGVLWTSPADQINYSAGQSCPQFPMVNQGIQPPPFMAAGTTGQILTCSNNPSAGDPSVNPSGGSAYCPSMIGGCTYIYGANLTGGQVPDLNSPIYDEEGNITGYDMLTPAFGDTGYWSLYPAGQLQQYGDDDKLQAAQNITVSAVWRITEVESDVGSVNNMLDWSCETKPPGLGGDFPDDPNIQGKIAAPKTDTKASSIKEIKLSKKIRKSLKDFYTKK